MNSEFINLDNLDNLDLKCEIHEISIIGVCGDNYCPEHRFLCMQCALDIESCIMTKRHELISLSEFIHRFFLKQEKGILDINRTKSLSDIVKSINKLRFDIRRNLLKIILKNIYLIIAFNIKIMFLLCLNKMV